MSCPPRPAPWSLPGGSLSLTLYWQAQGPTDQNYTLFVHFLGPEGSSYGQVDRLDPEMPSSSWAAGQVIADEIVLPIAVDAPPGAYHIAVGFYDAAQGDRLPVVDSTGHLLAGDQAVLPVGISNAGGSP